MFLFLILPNDVHCACLCAHVWWEIILLCSIQTENFGWGGEFPGWGGEFPRVDPGNLPPRGGEFPRKISPGGEDFHGSSLEILPPGGEDFQGEDFLLHRYPG